MNKAFAVLLGTGMTAASVGSVFAYQGNPNVQGLNYSPECHEAMEQAFETNNYQAWKELVQENGRVVQVINEGNFARFAEAHPLALAGKTEEANQIRTELGLGLHNGTGNGQQRGMGQHRNR